MKRCPTCKRSYRKPLTAEQLRLAAIRQQRHRDKLRLTSSKPKE